MNTVTDYLTLLREDLRDSRMLPMVGAGGVAMVAALAFVVLGGSGSADELGTPRRAFGERTSAAGAAASRSAQTSTSNAVAETTERRRPPQHKGGSRNPFALLPAAIAAEAKAAARPAELRLLELRDLERSSTPKHWLLEQRRLGPDRRADMPRRRPTRSRPAKRWLPAVQAEDRSDQCRVLFGEAVPARPADRAG